MAAWGAGMCGRRTRHRHRECAWHRDREKSAECSEHAVFGNFGVARDVPSIRDDDDRVHARKASAFVWSCGTRVLHGQGLDDGN